MRYFLISYLFLLGTEGIANATMNDSIRLGNVQRYYNVTIPVTYSGNSKPALILALHGYHHEVSSFSAYSGLDKLAEKNGVIVAYPVATKIKTGYYCWNAGNIYEEWTSGADDVLFIDILIEKLIGQFNIDTQQIFVVGYSNGAMMAYRLAAQLSGKIAAVACISGTAMDTTVVPNCPVSVMHIHGDADMAVPHTGAKQYGLQIPPVDDAIRNWIGWNKCPTVPTILTYNTTLTALKWSGNAEVRLYLLHGLGHDWPSKERGGWAATDVIWEFLQNQHKIPCL